MENQWLDTKTCPVCGKVFGVRFPTMWGYKRQNKYICSWKCVRLFDRTKGENDMGNKERGNMEQVTAEVARLLSGGEDPIPYLAGLGYENPRMAYTNVKKLAKAKFPELYRVFPEDLRLWRIAKEKEAKAAVELDGKEYEKLEPPTLTVDGPLNIETPEGNRVRVVEVPEKKPKITKPVMYGGLEVSAVRSGEFGEFYCDLKYNSVDWRTAEGEEVSMAPRMWAKMARKLPEILRILGVDPDE